MGFEKTRQNQKKKPAAPPKPPPKEITEDKLDKQSKEKLIGLREELEATCRHRQEVLAEKKEEMERIGAPWTPGRKIPELKK